MNDGEGFVHGNCKHPHLFFGSGGFLVICAVCSTIWKASTADFVKTDLDDNDVRLDTTVKPKTKKQLEDSPIQG